MSGGWCRASGKHAGGIPARVEGCVALAPRPHTQRSLHGPHAPHGSSPRAFIHTALAQVRGQQSLRARRRAAYKSGRSSRHIQVPLRHQQPGLRAPLTGSPAPWRPTRPVRSKTTRHTSLRRARAGSPGPAPPLKVDWSRGRCGQMGGTPQMGAGRRLSLSPRSFGRRLSHPVPSWSPPSPPAARPSRRQHTSTPSLLKQKFSALARRHGRSARSVRTQLFFFRLCHVPGKAITAGSVLCQAASQPSPV